MFKNGVEGDHFGAMQQNRPFKVSLDNFVSNTDDTRRVVSENDGIKVEKKDIISIEDYDISAKARDLKKDYERPKFLDNTLRHQRTNLSLVP